MFWSYVVANRFPDLEIRENNGNRLLRLEIKCLQCVAEEKSANFDTLIKDINPNTDFVIVCLWDWDNRGNNICQWDSAPKLFKIYVFHAYSLAQLRDTYWPVSYTHTKLARTFGFNVSIAETISLACLLYTSWVSPVPLSSTPFENSRVPASSSPAPAE